MRTIINLFGRSPFIPLRKHMENVASCVHLLKDLFDSIYKSEFAKAREITEKIHAFEHEADTIKNDIRNHLPKSLFLPVDRSQLLEILSLQDSLADRAEDVAVLSTLQEIQPLAIFKDDFKLFLDKNLESFDEALKIIEELHELLESSFGGFEAEKVSEMIERVAFKEHEADIIQHRLLCELLKADKELGIGSFFLWQKIFESVGEISNISETLAYRVRMTLELK